MRKLKNVFSPRKEISFDSGVSKPGGYDNILSEEWQAKYPTSTSVENGLTSSDSRERHDNDSVVSQVVAEPNLPRSMSLSESRDLKDGADSVDSAKSSSRKMSPRSTVATEEHSSINFISPKSLVYDGDALIDQEQLSTPSQEDVPDVARSRHSQKHSDSDIEAQSADEVHIDSTSAEQSEQLIGSPKMDDSQAPLKWLIDEFKSCCDPYDVNKRYVAHNAAEISALLVGTNSQEQLKKLIQKVGELAEMPFRLHKPDLKVKTFLENHGNMILINRKNVATALQTQEVLPFGREKISAKQQSVIGSFVELYNSIASLKAEIVNSDQLSRCQRVALKQTLIVTRKSVINFMKDGDFSRNRVVEFDKYIKLKMTIIYLAQPTQKVKTLCNGALVILANIVTVGLINFWKDSKGCCFTSALFKLARSDFESRHRVLDSVTAIERSRTLSR